MRPQGRTCRSQAAQLFVNIMPRAGTATTDASQRGECEIEDIHLPGKCSPILQMAGPGEHNSYALVAWPHKCQWQGATYITRVAAQKAEGSAAQGAARDTVQPQGRLLEACVQQKSSSIAKCTSIVHKYFR